LKPAELPRSVPIAGYAIFAAIALLGGALDLISKQAVFAWRGFPREGNVYWLLEPYFGIETSLNPGALFGFGAGNSHWFAVLSIAAAIGITTWLTYGGAARDRWLAVSLGLVMAGIIGNLYDRVGLWHYDGVPDAWRCNVRDWILIQYPAPWDGWKLTVWPNFNIADSCLVIGACVLVLHAFLTPRETEAAAKPKA
jgi:signal peptidase II